MAPGWPGIVRAATEADFGAITAIAKATGQDEDWDRVYPAYLRHLSASGSFLVAERAGSVAGFGATIAIGAGQAAVSMLTDLFVLPSAHGTGAGRALLSQLWADAPRRMTFSSLHANALPLYTSFGTDAWWPLLYLTGEVRALAMPAGWSVETASAVQAGALELTWTGVDRTADHAFWASWPGGRCAVASRAGQPVAAGSVGGAGAEYGICHLALAQAGDAVADDVAADAVLAVLSWLRPADGRARVCLPAPHPATRALLSAGWRIAEFDLHMASEPGLIDPRRSVLSAALA